MIKSPCIKKCKYLPGTNTCGGCLRNRYEISNWTKMTDQEKLEVIEKIKERRDLNNEAN